MKIINEGVTPQSIIKITKAFKRDMKVWFFKDYPAEVAAEFTYPAHHYYLKIEDISLSFEVPTNAFEIKQAIAANPTASIALGKTARLYPDLFTEENVNEFINVLSENAALPAGVTAVLSPYSNLTLVLIFEKEIYDGTDDDEFLPKAKTLPPRLNDDAEKKIIVPLPPSLPKANTISKKKNRKGSNPHQLLN